jgi:ATP-dependent RNA helicase RhlE
VRLGSPEPRSVLLNFEQFSLDRRIAAGVKSVGYTTPTPIQKKAIPMILRGRDIIGLAQTGTGKTAAFVLPILQHLLQGPRGKVRALIVAPTRELAEQTHQEIVKLGRNTKIRSVTIYGGVSKGPQLAALRRGVEIVVACPGRLLDHVYAGALDLSHVEVLVLDEADRMCDMGFLPDIRRIIKLVPEKRQTLFFSATMPPDIRALADKILTDPESVQIGTIAPAGTVSHALYPVPETRRKELLVAMLRRTKTGRVLVFTRTKHRADNLAVYMKKQGYRVAALQGNMTQNQRQQAINGFRSGKTDMLVATDIAARGIDVSKISHVVNFDMPDTVDAYTHRIGRTGRAEHLGEAFTFAVRGDSLMVKEIEKAIGTKLERRSIPDFDYGSGFDPERQFPQKSSTSSRLSRSFAGHRSRHRSFR